MFRQRRLLIFSPDMSQSVTPTTPGDLRQSERVRDASRRFSAQLNGDRLLKEDAHEMDARRTPRP
jgi:hypothetical protein